MDCINKAPAKGKNPRPDESDVRVITEDEDTLYAKAFEKCLTELAAEVYGIHEPFEIAQRTLRIRRFYTTNCHPVMINSAFRELQKMERESNKAKESAAVDHDSKPPRTSVLSKLQEKQKQVKVSPTRSEDKKRGKLYTNIVSDVNYVYPSYAVLISIWAALYSYRIPMTAVINAAGIYKENRVANTVNLVLQVVVAIVGALFFGIKGVLACPRTPNSCWPTMRTCRRT